MTDRSPLVRLEGITKAYPGVLANDDVSLDLLSGEIHTILGENGAGKSTLMGVVAGLHRPDAGRLFIRGEEVSFESPREALAHGVGYVQQHTSLIPILTVAQNAVLALRTGGQRSSVGGAAQKIRRLAERYELNVSTDAPVEELSVGEQQRAEILKALVRDPTILILDEPSSLLTPQEAMELAAVLRRLAGEGAGVFLISHKLEEVLSVSDRVSVLRRGRHVATMAARGASQARLAELMIGELRHRVTVNDVSPSSEPPGAVRLEVDGVSLPGDRGNEAVRDVSFEVRAGEVLGIAGLEGSGQIELTEAIAGVRRVRRGRILMDGRAVAEQRHHVAHIPSDRIRTGFVPTLSVEENLVLPVAGDSRFSRSGLLRRRAVRTQAEELIGRFDIRAAGPDVDAATLSGGNQQKLILARELAGRPGLIVCCYPTRGLDFAATEAVQREIVSRREEGAAVIYASVDLEELLRLTDRIVVLHGGSKAGEVITAQATAEELGLLMMGGDAA